MLDRRFRRGNILLRRLAPRQLGEQRLTRLRSGLEEIRVRTPSWDFGEREVVSGARPRSTAHRDAEARTARRTAVERHHEQSLAPGPIVRIDVGAAEEDPVLDRDGSEPARANPDEGETLGEVALRPIALRHHSRALLAPLGPPEAQHGRMQESLPGLRADGIAEECIIAAPDETVAAARLRIRDGPDIVIDDRAVPHRLHRAPTVLLQLPSQPTAPSVDAEGIAGGHAHHGGAARQGAQTRLRSPWIKLGKHTEQIALGE